MSKFQQYLLGSVLVIVGINMVGLWAAQYLALRKLDRLEGRSQVTRVAQAGESQTDSSLETTSSTTNSPSDNSDSSLMSDIKKAVASLTKRVVKLEEAAQTEVPVTAPTTSSTKTSIQPAEKIIAIGSGQKNGSQWADIPSLQLEVNSYNYPDVKSVKFEAALSVVSGIAEARLVNKASNSVIIESQLSHNSSQPTIKLSNSFSLHQGSVTYQVQVRSSSGETVSVDGAKLRLSY